MTPFRMSTLSAATAIVAIAAALALRGDVSEASTTFTAEPGAVVADAGVPGVPGADATRTYAAPVKVGEGSARAYVIRDETGNGETLEIGVALDERALDGLPTTGSGHHDGHVATHEFILQLPAENGTPFQFVEMNWNPSGHEPEGVYMNVPHFDFHFYTISKAERDAIVPSDPQYAAKANRLPASEYVPASNAVLGPPGAPASAVAVPLMGVHWIDVRSPELQALFGNPAGYKPFTTTFIHGSWDGRFHFWEPMITRAHIVEKRTTTDPAVRDEVIQLPTPARYQKPGRYPSAYRITWDAEAKEYRIALTKLSERE